MSRIIKVLLAIVIALIAIQFIRPVPNKSDQVLAMDLSKTIYIPDSVQVILKNACYDCHSNNTVYPWYSNVQPIAWFLAGHIKDAKEKLNFSEFGKYSTRRQISKLDGIYNSIKDDIMPLYSYKLMHKSAHLTSNKKKLIMNWAQQTKDNLLTKK